MWNQTGSFPNVTTTNNTTVFRGAKPGVYARFKNVSPTDTVMVRYGLSWLSIERACQNARKEVGDWNFERLRRESEKAWRAKLAPITIGSEGVDKSHLRNYWSGVYRAFLSPQDYTGENQLWESSEPYYDSWYCIWDTFRGVHPFYMLVDTVSQSRMVRSLIDTQKHLGWLPDVRLTRLLLCGMCADLRQ
jgi:putative alpha-1,2-mannosidase